MCIYFIQRYIKGTHFHMSEFYIQQKTVSTHLLFYNPHTEIEV